MSGDVWRCLECLESKLGFWSGTEVSIVPPIRAYPVCGWEDIVVGH